MDYKVRMRLVRVQVLIEDHLPHIEDQASVQYAIIISMTHAIHHHSISTLYHIGDAMVIYDDNTCWNTTRLTSS